VSDLNDTLAEALNGRHTSTRSVAQWFMHEDRADLATETRRSYLQLAVTLLLTTPDGPELTVALRRLLESLDSALRAGAA
jgi:hypothetical protein